jgi:hypothetical protein
MSKVIAYKNTERQCFFQIRFDNREKVLVSVANTPEHSIKVFKLIAGILPLKTIWEYRAIAATEKEAHKEIVSMLLGEAVGKTRHPLDAMVVKLFPCRSCGEAVRILRQAEQVASRKSS